MAGRSIGGMDPPQAQKEAPLERHFRLLEAVAASARGLSLTELVAVLELPKTTVHRLLQRLTSIDVLAAENPRFGPYVLGSRFLGMLQMSMPESVIEGLAAPFLKELVERTGDTCFVARLRGTSIRSVAMATPENDVHVYVVPGSILSPLHAAAAKAILAHQDKHTIAAVLGGGDREAKHDPQTLKRFEEELAAVKASGVAFNAGEDIAGFAAIASPVHLPSVGVRYSLAVTGTFDKLMAPDNKERVAESTRHFAGRLGRVMAVGLNQAALEP